ncbi:MAG: TIR domain-containing protein [Pseudomonadota bacterium]
MHLTEVFDVFLSYDRRDAAMAERLAGLLRDAGQSVFFDAWSIAPGDDWITRVEDALSSCRATIVLAGRHGLSGWQKREVGLALERQRYDSTFRVVPAVLPGAEDLPLGFLSLNNWVMLERGIADADALAKLIAGVAGRVAAQGDTTPLNDDICPYRGLEPFREEDAPFFFGRETFAKRLTALARERRFVVVVGASGSGKSSIVNAGLCPVLRRGAEGEAWDILAMRPGASPLTALVRVFDPPTEETSAAEAVTALKIGADALKRGEMTLSALAAERLARNPALNRLLLVVDQFEEATTLAADHSERENFIDALLELVAANPAARVVATLRSDFYSDIVSRRDLIEELDGAVMNVGPLSRIAPADGLSEMETAIRRPAEATGLRLAEGLADRIIAEVGEAPGDLPLLEYLLTELWRRREGGVLTHAAYDAIGGVRGAIATRAEEAYAALSALEKTAARRVFLSLVAPGEGARDTRARAAYPEEAAAAAVVDRFAGRRLRLLVSGEDSGGRAIDLGHEALIDGWSRFGDWIDESRSRLRILARMRARRRRWAERERIDDLLLPSGLELEEGRSLLAAADEIAVDEVRDYIEASIAADAARIEAGRKRAEAEAAAKTAVKQRQRRIFAGAAALSFLFLAIAAWQWRAGEFQREAAEAERIAAAEKSRLAEARSLAEVARRTLENNPGETSVAAMIAVDALRLSPSHEAVGVLRDALALAPRSAALAPTPWRYARVASSADGRVAAFTDPGLSDRGAFRATIVELDANLDDLRAHDFDGLVTPKISPDGRWLAASGHDRRLVVIDRRTGERVVDAPTRGGVFPAFSPDGERLYAATQTGDLLRYDVKNWRERPQLTYPLEGASSDPAFIAVGAADRLLLLSGNRSVQAVDGESGDAAALPLAYTPDDNQTFRRVPSGVWTLPGGARGLVFDNRGGGAIWDFATGEVTATFDDGANRSSGIWSSEDAIAWDAEARYLARATFPGAVTIWSLETGEIAARFDHVGDAYALAFSPDGARLVVVGEGGATIWSAADGARLGACETEDVIQDLALSPADGAILMGGEEGGLYRCPPEGGAAREVRRFDRAIMEMAAAPEGGIALTLSSERHFDNFSEISFIEAASGRELSRVLINGGLEDVSLSPDGSLAAARERQQKVVHVWRTDTGERLQKIAADDQFQGFEPRGERLRFRGLGLWTHDLVTGERSADMGEPGGVYDVYLDPKTGAIVTRGSDGADGDDHRGWSPETGEMIWRRPSQGDYLPRANLALRYVRKEEGSELRLIDFSAGRMIGAAKTEETSVFDWIAPASRDRVAFAVLTRDEKGRQYQAPRVVDLATGENMLTSLGENVVRAGIKRLSNDLLAVVELVIEDGSQKVVLRAIRWEDGGEVWRAPVLRSGFKEHVSADEAGARLLISADEGVNLLDGATGETIWSLPDRGFIAAAFPSGGETIVLNDVIEADRHRLVFVDAATGAIRSEAPLEAGVRVMRATSDGSHVLVGLYRDDTYAIEAWRVADGVRTYRTPMDISVRDIAPLKDPNRFVALDFGGGARVFDLRDETGEAAFRLVHAYDAGAGFFAEGAPRAVTMTGASIRYWNSRSGEEIAAFRAEGDIGSIAISPDGAEVAFVSEGEGETSTGAAFRTLTFWRPEEDAAPRSIPVEAVTRISYDPTGRLLALPASGKQLVRFIDRETLLTQFVIRPPAGKELDTDPVAFTADGRFAGVTISDNYGQRNQNEQRTGARIFDLIEGREVMRFDIRPYSRLTSGPGGIYYSGDDLRLREAALPQEPLDRLFAPLPGDTVRVFPQGDRFLLTGFWDADKIVDLASGAEIEITAVEDGFRTTGSAIDHAGERVAICRQPAESNGRPAILEIYDGRSGERIAAAEDPTISCRRIAFIGDGGSVVYMDNVSPRQGDETFSQNLRRWSWRGGAIETMIGDNPVSYVSVSRDGARMVTVEGAEGSDDRIYGTPQVRVWDTATGKPTLTIADADIIADAVHLGSRVKISGTGRFLALFDTFSPSEGEVIDLDAPGGPTRILAVEREDDAFWGAPLGFAADDRFFILGVGSGARVYDLETGEMRPLREAVRIRRFSLSEDGRYVALSGDGATSIWDVESGEKRFEMTGDDPWRLIFAPEPDGRLILRKADRVELVEWRDEALIEQACVAFSADRWASGRARILGRSAGSPCE